MPDKGARVDGGVGGDLGETVQGRADCSVVGLVFQHVCMKQL